MTKHYSICLIILFTALVVAGRAHAQECYQSSISSPTPFMGNNGEIFKLVDGSVWEVKYEYEYLYEYYPSVVMCPGRGKLIVGRKTLNVQLISGMRSPPKGPTPQLGGWNIFEETNLQGTISGIVRIGTVFKTISGHVYEVTGVTIQVVVAVQPQVMVLTDGATYKLVVQGFDEPLICRKLN